MCVFLLYPHPPKIVSLNFKLQKKKQKKGKRSALLRDIVFSFRCKGGVVRVVSTFSLFCIFFFPCLERVGVVVGEGVAGSCLCFLFHLPKQMKVVEKGAVA